MLNKVKIIAERAWAYALRKSDFLRFVFRGDSGAAAREPEDSGGARYDADWEGE